MTAPVQQEQSVRLRVAWAGFDYGQCIMEPGGLRNPRLWNELCRQLGCPERAAEKVARYRRLKEKYGSYAVVKEGHRDEIYSYVLEDDPDAIALFGRKEKELLAMGDGLVEALEGLQSMGIELAVVSEMKKTLGPVSANVVSTFLKTRGLTRFFRHLITPEGKIDLRDDSVDPRYRGHTKEGGTIYDVLAAELRERGIEPEEAVMVGDKPTTDINPANARGFKTVQYTGFIDLGPSYADRTISHFSELLTTLEPAR